MAALVVALAGWRSSRSSVPNPLINAGTKQNDLLRPQSGPENNCTRFHGRNPRHLSDRGDYPRLGKDREIVRVLLEPCVIVKGVACIRCRRASGRFQKMMASTCCVQESRGHKSSHGGWEGSAGGWLSPGVPTGILRREWETLCNTSSTHRR